MRIAILGAGNAGCAAAADLTQKGHEVCLIKTSNSMHNENFEYILQNKTITMIEDDRENVLKISQITKDISEVAEAEVIIIYTQTVFHEQLIKRISEYLNKEQILIINPGYLSTAYFLKHCSKENMPIIVEAESSFIDCRIYDLGKIKVSFRNVRNPVGVYPKAKTEYVRQKLESLDYSLEYITSIEAALHNPNLIVHTVGAIMSIPRVEKTNGDYCMYHEVFTPGVWKILEQLDKEKMDIIEKLGFDRLSYVEACKYRNSLDDSRDAKEVFFWYASMPTAVKGPTSIDSRYISEDVPQGLVMLETLGKQLNIPTPVCTSLIEIATAALGRDMRLEGRTLEHLGEENVQKILKDSKSY